MGDREQRSKELGVKLAKALIEHANTVQGEVNVDTRYVMLGAAEYLHKASEVSLNPPLDPRRTAHDERQN